MLYPRIIRKISVIFIITVSCLFISGEIATAADEPIYIGVLLPLSGPEGQPLFDALQLAKEQINSGGGINGRPVEYILRDTRTGDLKTYANALVHDPRIRVVIGPYSSADLFEIADLFITNQKVLISGTASSDEIYRAYAGTGAIWRTIANDGDITSVVMQHIKEKNGKTVALLTVNDTYGKTFYDWIPYWGIEQGINITAAEEYSDAEKIPDAVGRLTTEDPDYLIFAHSGSGYEVAQVIDSLEEHNSSAHPYFIYPAIDEQGRIWERADPDTLLFLLSSGLWKIDDTSTLATPLPDDTLILMTKPWDAEFFQEFSAVSGKNRSDFVPEVYDAALASALIMARFNVHPDKSPKNAAMAVLANGTGELLPRTPEGFQSAFRQITEGKFPILTGATGLLTFKPEGTDRQVPWFETYRIEEDKIVPDPVSYQHREKTGIPVSGQENTSNVASVESPDSSGGEYWAVIGAFSRDWENYRHQADALTMYQYVKGQGVPDDHIILLVYDDIPQDKQNKKPGEVYHTPGEEEVRKLSNPDIIGEMVNKEMLSNVLLGTGSEMETSLLQSDENATVLVYISSHGSSSGDLIFGDGSETVSPGEMSQMIDEMYQKKRFEKMLIVLESCFSGNIADAVKTPGVLVLAAAAQDETSKAAIYDSELSSWLSDEFTKELVSILRQADPTLTLRHLYQQVFYQVRSSHPDLSQGNELLEAPAYQFFGGN